MADIETVYRARIDYDVDATDDSSDLDKLDRIAAYASDLGDKHGVHVDCASGGPCWNAYLVLEGATRYDVSRVAKGIENYIRKFKGGKVIDD